MKKRNLLLLLVLLMFSVSCTNGGFVSETISPVISIAPIEENISDEKALDIYIYSTDLSRSYMNYDLWSEFIEDQYNITLQVSLYLLENTQNMLTGDLDGIYAIDLMEYFNIENPNQYFSSFNDIEAVKEINNGFIKNHYSDNGEILTLPYDYRYPSIYVRKYNTDILNGDFEVPKTLHSLFETLSFAKSNISNEDIYLMEKLNNKDIFKSYTDILQSFDINMPNNSVAYNEFSNSYYDIMTTKNMEDCVNYLKFLVEKDILPIDYATNISFDNGNLFSQYKFMGYDLEYPYSIYLLNDEFDYPCTILYNPTRTVYLLGKNTIVGDNVNNFINQVYNNSMASVALRYGIPGEDYEYINGKVVLEENADYKNRPNVVGGFPYNNRISSSEFDDNNYYKVQNDLMKSGIVKELSIYSLLPYAKYNTCHSDYGAFSFSQEYNKHLYTYLSSDEISYSDYISTYIKSVKTKNAEDEINKLNRMIGSELVFKYNEYGIE